MISLTPEKEHDWKNRISKSDEQAFSDLFHSLYSDLVLFASRYHKEKELCEDIVQDVFTKLWLDRKSIEQIISIRSYLMQAVKNRCLDHLRHFSVRQRHHDQTQNTSLTEDSSTYNYVLYSELKDKLDEALRKLPKECREAFELNRFSTLKYKEIAKKLNVSQRTIEVRIGKAISILRELLKDFLHLLIVFFLKNTLF